MQLVGTMLARDKCEITVEFLEQFNSLIAWKWSDVARKLIPPFFLHVNVHGILG